MPPVNRLKNILQALAHSIGLDIKRYHPQQHPLAFVQNLKIQTIIDIGANTGQFARDLRAMLPQAHIYSFEPLRDCYAALQHNFRHDRKFTAFNSALGDSTTTMVMHKSQYAPSSSLQPMSALHQQVFPHSREHTNETITIQRLDDISRTLTLTPELLVKIDVQGFEDKVIAGGSGTLRQAKAIIIENSFYVLYKGQKLFGDLYKQLTELGFVYHGSIGHKLNPTTGTPLFEDSIFIRP